MTEGRRTNEGTLSSAKVHKGSRYKWRNGVCSEASNRLFLQIQINKPTGHSGALILTQMEKGDVSTHSALTPPPSNSSVQVYFSMSEHPDGRTLAAFFFFFFQYGKLCLFSPHTTIILLPWLHSPPSSLEKKRFHFGFSGSEWAPALRTMGGKQETQTWGQSLEEKPSMLHLWHRRPHAWPHALLVKRKHLGEAQKPEFSPHCCL